MVDWNVLTIFNFTIERNSFPDPCSGSDVRNGVSFQSTVCGTTFGSTTLAVERSFSNAANGKTQSIITFNSSHNWDVYFGPLIFGVTDFRRVALHELGHTLGLFHEEDVPAIMASLIGDLDQLQFDDIAGVGFLYDDADLDGVASAFDNCPVVRNPAQTNTDGLGAGNACAVDDDNDGVPDATDAFPIDSSFSIPLIGAVTVPVDARANGLFGELGLAQPDASLDMVSGLTFVRTGSVRISAAGSIDVNPINPKLQSIEADGEQDLPRTTFLGGPTNFNPLEEKDVDIGGVGVLTPSVPNRSALFGAFVPKNQVDAAGFQPRDEDLGATGISSAALFLIGSGPLEFNVTEPGTLFLGVNEGFGSNNTGAYQVAIIPVGDADGDTITDLLDNCQTSPNFDQTDTDGDLQGNECDADDDNDGVVDSLDALPLDPGESADTDADGVGDNADNCVATANPEQANDDGDAAGNLCDFFPADPLHIDAGLTHNYVVGLNLVPLSISGGLVTSSDFATAIETGIAGATVVRIIGFDTASQTFLIHQGPLSFPLTRGQAYFVTIAGSGGTLNLSGPSYATVNIANCLTFLGVEPASLGILNTSTDLAAKLEIQAADTGAIIRIVGWDAAQQLFRVHQGPLNFNLNPLTEGAIIFSTKAFLYAP